MAEKPSERLYGKELPLTRTYKTKKEVERVKMLDYEANHYCPVYEGEVTADLCYDSLCCLKGLFKVSSTKELNRINDIEAAKAKCRKCPYSNLNGGQ